MPSLDALMPHRPPMRMLEAVVEASAEHAVGRMVVREDNPFLGKDGLLDRAAFPEIMAQCFAAGAGQARGARVGYLAAMRHIVMHGDARLGDALDVTSRLVTSLSGVMVIAASIARNGELLAEGELKVYIPEPLPGNNSDGDSPA